MSLPIEWKVRIKIVVNGEEKDLLVRPSDTLLYALRDLLGLTGAKPGCKNGDCGACTVLVNEIPIKSCLMLAVEAVGQEITTIEGLKNTEIQKAFVKYWGFQCGYCTPGFIVNSYALTSIHPEANNYQIKEWLQSNICRCTGYAEIERAVKSVLKQNNSEKKYD